MSGPQGGLSLWGTLQDLVDPNCDICQGNGEVAGETCECVEETLEKARKGEFRNG
jgi:hypothetical protein